VHAKRPPIHPAAILTLILPLALAACSAAPSSAGSAEPSPPPSSAAPSSAGSAEPSPPPSSAAPSSAGGPEAAEALAGLLAPPNGTEFSHSTAGGLVSILWDTRDSIESLTDYYGHAIPDAGLDVVRSTATGEAVSWTFEAGAFSGTLGLAPAPTSAGGPTVTVVVLDHSV